MKSLLLVLVVFLLAAHCEVEPKPPVDPPVPAPTETDAPVPPPPTPPPIQVPTCTTACVHQRELGCPLGESTAEGASCEEVCENSAKAPIPGLAWDVEKLSVAEECDK